LFAEKPPRLFYELTDVRESGLRACLDRTNCARAKGESGGRRHENKLKEENHLSGKWTLLACFQHPCGADLYQGQLLVGGKNCFIIKWKVKGPNKDGNIIQEYTREVAAGGRGADGCRTVA
jgi:hypothetical protein